MIPKIVITGCGHSGTRWVSGALQRAGFDARHETAAGIRGIRWEDGGEIEVSWLAAGALDSLPPDVWVIHLVRHPLAVATTFRRRNFFALDDFYNRFIRERLGTLGECPELDYWNRWNALVEDYDLAELMRVEEIGTEFLQRVGRYLGRDPLVHGVPPRPAPKPRFTPADLQCRDLRATVRRSALYGYTLEG